MQIIFSLKRVNPKACRKILSENGVHDAMIWTAIDVTEQDRNHVVISVMMTAVD